MNSELDRPAVDDRVDAGGRARRFLSRPFVWRALAFVAVYLAAVVGLSLGVGVSERDLVGVGLAERAYYALGLFVLGGLDIGTPIGGPAPARSLLWFAYFAAPIITAFAIIETALRLFGPLKLRVRPLAGHVVVAGAGRLTVLYVRKLRQRHPRKEIVVVELQSETAFMNELRDLHRAIIVRGDITRDKALDELRLDRAHRVLLLTGDDFTNLDAAAKILRRAPDLAGRVVVHVSDLGFLRETAGSSVAHASEIFNGHEFAARHLVKEHLAARFQNTSYRDPVVLAGFGRFGRTVLDQLQRHASGSFGPVVILDEQATRHARTFEEEPGFSSDYVRVVVDGDALDPDTWRRIRAEVDVDRNDPVIIFGAGSDGTNLQAALAVGRRHPTAHIVVRSFRTSPFTAEIAQETGIHAVNLGELVQAGMPDAWF